MRLVGYPRSLCLLTEAEPMVGFCGVRRLLTNGGAGAGQLVCHRDRRWLHTQLSSQWAGVVPMAPWQARCLYTATIHKRNSYLDGQRGQYYEHSIINCTLHSPPTTAHAPQASQYFRTVKYQGRLSTLMVLHGILYIYTWAWGCYILYFN